MADKRDFTYRFNTELKSADEDVFRTWLAKQSDTVGRDVAKDLYNYDLRGWWLKNDMADMAPGVHLNDRYKKPNHPTFSNESKYHGEDGAVGGEWIKDAAGNYTFKVGKTNLEHYTPEELKQYFKTTEPDVTLSLGEEP